MNNQNKRITQLFALVFFLIPLAGYPGSFQELEPDADAPHYLQDSSMAVQNYQQLQQMIPIYQSAVTYPWTPISSQAKLKLGAKNLTVLDLRARLTLMRDLNYNNGSDIVDPQLLNAVKNFQERVGLVPDGVVGPKTRAELNVRPDERLKQIEINIQRWVELSPNLGNRFLLVNVPDFKLYLIDHDQTVLSMKIIAGKPDWPTPKIGSRITRLVLNPYWNVPDPIAKKDVIPKLMKNPEYLAENNIRVFRGDDDDAPEIDPNEVNWESVLENGTTSDFHFRQDSGETNSLGQLKFEFANSYDVYLHGTPVKELFSEDKRDFSHGCVRLENPSALADYLMQDDPNWSDDKMDELIASGETRYKKVKNPLPIFITYFTAWIDENGRVNFRDDVYGRDQ